jgi:hypothetical protein
MKFSFVFAATLLSAAPAAAEWIQLDHGRVACIGFYTSPARTCTEVVPGDITAGCRPDPEPPPGTPEVVWMSGTEWVHLFDGSDGAADCWVKRSNPLNCKVDQWCRVEGLASREVSGRFSVFHFDDIERSMPVTDRSK